jgi:hypothetical protein
MVNLGKTFAKPHAQAAIRNDPGRIESRLGAARNGPASPILPPSMQTGSRRGACTKPFGILDPAAS